MNDDTHDDVLGDIRSFVLLDSPDDADLDTDGHCQLHVMITLELPGGRGLNTLPLTVTTDILDRLERDGLRPHRTTVEITETATP